MFSKLLKKSYFINAVSKFKYSSVGYDKYNLLKSTIPTCTMIVAENIWKGNKYQPLQYLIYKIIVPEGRY